MAAPPRDTRGRATLDDARPPDGKDRLTVTRSGKMVVEIERVRRGAWDVWADEELQAETHATAPVPRTTPPRTPDRADGVHKLQRRAMKLTQKALALRVQGWDVVDIAAELGVAPQTVTGWFATHRRMVDEQQIDAMLDSIAVPLATDNLIHGLIAGDKDYTLETLKGRGKLRRHAEGDGKLPAALPELRIVFEAGGSPSADSTIAGGRILGAMALPKLVDGTVVSRDPLPHAVQEPRASAEAATADGRGEVPASGMGSLGVGNPGDTAARDGGTGPGESD